MSARQGDEEEDLENPVEVRWRKERHRRGDEGFHLRGKIDSLEADKRGLERECEQLGEELAYSKKQLADADQREKNLKEQLGIVKRSLRVRDEVKEELETLRESERRLKELADALLLENTTLREELEDQSELLDQTRRENSSLRLRNTDSDELERDFQVQKQLIMTVLEGETSKANKAVAEAKETAEAKEDSHREELDRMERLLREKEAALENEVMEKWKFHAEKEEQRQAFEEKETELRGRVEELSNALVDRRGTAEEEAESARNAELRAEMERLVERHHESLVGRDLEHALEVERLQDDWKTKLEGLEDKLRRANANHGEQLSKALNDNRETSDKLNRKTHQCAELERNLENCREELEKLRNKATPRSDEDKIGKLERALVRLKLENDQLKSTKSAKGTKELLREKESHIIDLQSEVTSLREALKKRPAEESAETLVSHRRLLEEASMLRAALDGPGSGSGPPCALVEQLFEARRKLNASGARISQLEKWLDEIFNTDLKNFDGELGLKKSKGSDTYRTGIVLPELKSKPRVDLVNRLSKPKTK